MKKSTKVQDEELERKREEEEIEKEAIAAGVSFEPDRVERLLDGLVSQISDLQLRPNQERALMETVEQLRAAHKS